MSSYRSFSKNQKSKFRFNPYRKRMYDVFIGFRRQNPHYFFYSRLYAALKIAGVYVFVDDEDFADDIELTSGDLIISGAIEGSRVSIIVFTTNYADSTWRLQELVKIIECRSSKGQVVVPVFYEVDPSEVRNQTGHFGEALASMERNSTNENKVLTYRTALQEAAGISPRFVIDFRNEGEAIESIVEHVTSLLDSTNLFVAEHWVGVHSRVQDLIQILNYQKTNHVLLLGIWGMGGIGKTTIAKALYNQVSPNFEGRKFLPDISDRLVKNNMNSFPSLRDEILCYLGKDKKVKILTSDSRNLISRSVCHKKVLLVLDNLSSSQEPKSLFLSHEFYGPGSRIIITTRNKQVLREIGVDHVYRVEEMDYNECVELFSWCTFRKATPERKFAGLIKHVVEYSDGLPLALVALGSILIERSIEEWESILDRHRLKRFPLQDVQEVLKISIDDLEHHDKQIFLEIAYLSYFFIGMNQNDVIQILDGSGLSAEIGIRSLEDQSLVMFDEKNNLHMHPLLQDIGRENYQKESSIKPPVRNRLLFHEDIMKYC